MTKVISILFVVLVGLSEARAEDGSSLWLRYSPGLVNRPVVVQGKSATSDAIGKEFTMAGAGVVADAVDGAIIVGTPQNSDLIRRLDWSKELESLGPEGFVIRSAKAGTDVIVVASAGEIGALYGTFELIRLFQTDGIKPPLNIVRRPKLDRRLLNHWDNLDGSIERGYAGRSIWKWDDLPGKRDPRYTLYARANASIGINGAVLNNVNASPTSLSTESLKQA